MCGIAGELVFGDRAADTDAVRRMLPCLESRGPDGDGLWARERVAFGHRRLKIIDLSENGAQPMTDERLGLTVVFNGCIYNYRQLREELQGYGYTFFSTSDTEVILKAYHRWGADCVTHFLGMFAFAIAEHASGTVTLARDRLGIKPLYLAETPGRLRFASTLPALLAAGRSTGGGPAEDHIDTSIDKVALHHYMTFHSVVPAPRTIINGVRKLPPATVRVIRADGTSTERVYWEASFTRTPSLSKGEWAEAEWAEAEWAEAVRDRLRLAVERRMVADVPVGVLLSGGLDSSFIVALLAEQGQTGLTTFSIGFEAAGGESGDEFEYSNLIAAKFGTEHHQIRIGQDRFLPAVERTVAAMSEPMVSHDCIAFNLLSEDVAKQVKVVQSGQGADEIFAGYSWYPPLGGVPRDRAVEAYAKEFFDRPHSELAGQLNPEWLAENDPSLAFVRASFGRPGATTAVDAALRLDSQVMLVDDPVKRVDNMTMAWGLEARVPFLDHELVELAAACPPEVKLAQDGKGVLKDAARGLVPDEVIDRPKGYFPVPGIRHLEGPMLEKVRDALHARAARDRGLFRTEYVDALLADPNTPRTTLGANQLWQLALLEMWLQENGI
ncbi:putative asparagine synthetase [Actinoplanes missouriensis 431]|uniref:asparagine synthase (glutamine-hydrolyzing) n=1 Tax=Actinoplanes missouriensis (strain ATCC 14538 / DSM 43046 / CBS 188.64 / JCM 3121 / NBRC 102363 / NCIMB 12654 / NRRL B-3342 / UNCC 431) TaxID=512565 RepID=I0HFN0_ACTM4|nr:N-acetylglutaminylglutamine amidotransferase [Actinoplanes missouriensis]BAL91817.1 putative asparagine synthetase [Actinoplanes missouriensis 431]